MMSLSHPDLWSVVNKQFKYKWMSYKSVFQGLMIAQIIAMVFSLFGVASSSMGFGFIDLNIQYITGDFVFFFTCLWAFFISVALDRNENRLADQIFVTNSWSRHLANVVFIVIANMIGTITVVTASFFVKMIHIWIFGIDGFIFFGEYTLPGMLIFFIITFFYLILFSSLGYLIGSIMRQGKLIKFGVVLFVGGPLIFTDNSYLIPLFQFFGDESSVIWFILKILLTSMLAIGLTTLVSRRLEVQ